MAALVLREPGLHLRDIPRRLGLSLSAARYHLETLETEGVVVSDRAGRFVRFFAPGAYSAAERGAIAAAKVEGSRAVLEALVARGPLAFTELARAARLSNGALAWQLRALMRAGVVGGREERRYALPDREAVAMALALHRESRLASMEDAAREIFDDPL